MDATRSNYPKQVKGSKAIVICALVNSCLDYCNVLYLGLLLKTVWVDPMAQNHTTVLKDLYLLPICHQVQFKVWFCYAKPWKAWHLATWRTHFSPTTVLHVVWDPLRGPFSSSIIQQNSGVCDLQEDFLCNSTKVMEQASPKDPAGINVVPFLTPAEHFQFVSIINTQRVNLLTLMDLI